MKNETQKVCVFGIYDPGYAHNRMLMRGLEENGYTVVECRVDPKEFPGIKKYAELARIARAHKKKDSYTLILVLFPGHTVVWMARLLFPRTKIVFDAFVSLYDSNVHDRKIYNSCSLLALRDWLLDWSSVKLAWRVLLDTNAHIEYFVYAFGLARGKSIRVFAGTDKSLFVQLENRIQIPDTPFTIHFHGTYIPLQGIPYILGAARILQDEDVVFRVVGSSTSSAYARELRASAKDLVEKGSVVFIDAVPFSQLSTLMAESHVCLGIFGDTEKTQRVIPNKVYEILAMAPNSKPLITADTPAIRELLTEDTAVLVSAKPETMSAELAAAILTLKNNPQKCKKLADKAAELFESRLQPKQLVAELLVQLAI